jgi:hypothetical protein
MNTATTSAELVERPARRWAGVAAAISFAGIAGFEAALAAGAPLGHAAWGGAHAHLATGLREASAVAAVFWVLAALLVLGRVGYRLSPLPLRVCHYGTWVLTGLLAVGVLMNLASRSNWERYLQAPIALVAALLCLLAARAATPPPQKRRGAGS